MPTTGPTTSLRRALAAAVTAGATAAFTVLPAGGAHAAVRGDFGALAQSSATYTGTTSGGTCDLVHGDAGPTSPEVMFNRGTKHRSVDLDATYASSDDPTGDRVRLQGHLDSALTIHRNRRDLTSFDLSAGGTISARHSMSHSSCQGSATMLAGMSLQFTEHRTGWFYLTHTTVKPNSVIVATVYNVKNDAQVAFIEFAGGRSHLTSRAKLKPGSYAVGLAFIGFGIGAQGPIGPARAALADPAAASRTRAALTTSLTGVFKPITRR